MRILFLNRRFYPLIGGVEKHVLEVSKRLVAQGHQVKVLTESLNGRRTTRSYTQSYAKIEGIEVFRMNVGQDDWKKKFRIWYWLWENRFLLRSADIIHCHDVFFWYLPFRFFFPQKPVFTTFHGYESYPIKKKAILVRKITELFSWGNICIGDFIQKWYGTKPNYVSYGAVESSKFKIQNSKFKKESAVFFGRLDEQTGILTYARAVELIKKEYPKFEFLIIGDGKYKKLMGKNYSVKGFIKNPERYFEKYHFVFVSRYLSILEAFAGKRLVFAVYDNPIKKDYLKMSPFAKYMVIAANEIELTQKIEYYLQNPKKESLLREKAYRWAINQTWDKMVLTYLKLWKKPKQT